MANLPADLPEDWTQGQTISPNGTEVGLSEQHGYNYLMKQVNDTQNEVNNIGTTIEAALEDVAKEASVQEVITSIGDTGDTGGSTVAGTVMAKLNNIQTKNDNITDALPLLNSTIGTDNPVALDTIILQAVVGNVFEYTQAGNYILQIPATISKIRVTACGAGGGGGGAYSNGANGGGGGGGEAIQNQEYDVTPQSQLNITVGAGGAGGGSNAAGNTGGSTIIGSLVTLRGGNGGSFSNTASAQGASAVGNGGAGGNGIYVPKGTAITTPSGNGTAGLVGNGGSGILPAGNTTSTYSSNAGAGGGGGGSLGNGGNGQDGNGGGTNPSRGGGGGGGGSGYIAGQNRRTNGIAGAPGYVKIEWGYE